MFPVRGGMFHSVNKKIRKHEIIPSVSGDRICIRPCVRGMFYTHNGTETVQM
jgi:hypothetical protein